MHPLEAGSLLGGVAGNAVVNEPDNYPVAMIGSVGDDFGPLLIEALFLVLPGTAQVSRSGDQSGRMASSHDVPFLTQRVVVVRAA